VVARQRAGVSRRGEGIRGKLKRITRNAIEVRYRQAPLATDLTNPAIDLTRPLAAGVGHEKFLVRCGRNEFPADELN